MTSVPLRFSNPPIVELVLGAQFAPLPGWTSGHSGWFWKHRLPQQWTRATDAPVLPDLFERFGDQQLWQFASQMLLGIGVGAPPANRLQVESPDGQQMVQMQATRFHYNWRKTVGEYPSFEIVKEEFDARFKAFCEFAVESQAGSVITNQWEITYIDQIPRGELWESPADWHKVFPALIPQSNGNRPELERLNGVWTYLLNSNRGRVHAKLYSGRIGANSDQDALILETTARGPVSSANKGWDLDSGLQLGHEAITATFLGMVSKEARLAWGVREE
jgi:uncharacterized protein (TIGR04255 family)